MNTLHILQPVKFSCQRTCSPWKECMFGHVLRAIGSTKVMSHTVTITVEWKDRESLKLAVEAMGGTVIGEGRHQLFSSQSEIGLGFTLPNWRFPLILKTDNTLAFDDYHGQWGNVADITTLKEHYTIEVGRAAASQQGWMSEIQTNGTLLIFHPCGATITLFQDGTVDANGFVGTGCDAAAAIENALGSIDVRTEKAEYFLEEVHINAR